MKTNAKLSLNPLTYLATLLSVHVVFFFLNLGHVFQLPIKEVLATLLTSFLLILLSCGILFVKNNGEAAAQTFRFLIISVTQLLGYLSTSLALIYTDQSVELVLFLLGLSLSVLILQTSYFVRRLK
ncbi:MAG: hypothetical protein ACKOWX_02345 [Flavobacteriales bacterium]